MQTRKLGNNELEIPMTVWKSSELDRVDTAEELEIASLRRDGSLRSSRTIIGFS
jgi:hypothetical protein